MIIDRPCAFVLSLMLITGLAQPAHLAAQGGWVLWRQVRVESSGQWFLVASTADRAECLEQRATWLRTRSENPRRWEELIESVLEGKVYRSTVTEDGMRFVTTRNVSAAVSYHCLQAGVQPR